jgi:geranylgeranyl pyrophosphate synthase
LEELKAHSRGVVEIAGAGADAKFADFITVLVNNEVWRKTVAAVPFKRRTLLLPPCVRSRASCPAEFDEFGLLCRQCGGCMIGSLHSEAEKLGYAVLVAEGTSIVNMLIEQGMVDAVIGVGCMASLERAFPYMTESAVPGIAIPLLADGCDRTRVDLDWVRRELHLASCGGRKLPDIDRLRSEVESWFEPQVLRAQLGCEDTDDTKKTCIDWLAKAGKRWRPLLAACAFEALDGSRSRSLPDEIKAVALAVECFHKASLIHDDIEDGDDWRYGEQTLHRARGVPVALNAGDFLIFAGYRLIAECGATAWQVSAMLSVAAEGHRSLCLGQGRGLCFVRRPTGLSEKQVLDIFRLKTAPAFEVALRMGAISAGADVQTHRVLKRYSQAIGAAYQIQDDLRDFLDGAGRDFDARRPSLLLAIAFENADAEALKIIRLAWQGPGGLDKTSPDIRQLIAELGVEDRARRLLELYKAEAIRALEPLKNARLKTLLYRITGKILNSGA